MGCLRLLLSFMVLASHLAIYAGDINPGVAAVCVFFLISGYVMTALIEKHYFQPEKYGRFVLDRAMRLYPQFLAYVALTGLLMVVVHVETPFLTGLSVGMVLLNLAIIPLGYSSLFPALSNALIIPPAATLGLEFTFYLLFPLFLYSRTRTPAILLSFGVFLFAYSGIIDPDIYGYRLLPGTLFIFLLGSALRRHNQQILITAAAIYGICIILLLTASFNSTFRIGFNRDVLWGIVLGAPLVWALARAKENRFDVLAGNLSYGVFLNHFLLIWACQSAGIDPVHPTLTIFGAFVASSLILAAITFYCFERPIIRIRHRMRKRSEPMHSTVYITPSDGNEKAPLLNGQRFTNQTE